MLILTAFGIGKFIKAGFDAKKADSIDSQSYDIISKAKAISEQAQEYCGVSLYVVGNKKMFVLGTTIKRFVKRFKKIKNFEMDNPIINEEIDKFKIKNQKIYELRELRGYGSTIALGLLGGLFFGGIIVGARARANLDRAYANLAEAERISEELHASADVCSAIRRRSYLYLRLLIRLDSIFSPLVYQMEEIIKKYGRNYFKYSVESQNNIIKAYVIAVAIKAAIDTPILTSDGKLTKISRLNASLIQEKMESK